MARARGGAKGGFFQLSFFGLFDRKQEEPEPQSTELEQGTNSVIDSAPAEIAAVPSVEEQGHGEQDQIRGAAQRISGPQQPENVRGAGEEGRAEQPSRQDRSASAEDDGSPDHPDGERAARSEYGPEEARDSSGPDRDVRRRDRAARDRVRAPVISEKHQKQARLNYRITPADAIGQGGDKAKVRANIEAIRILKAIEEDERHPTDAEKQAIVRYVGWGAFAQALFDKNPNSANARTWAAERKELADLLTTEELDSARASTLNAHYTSESVVRGIWRAVEHLGFNGGRALEPAAGVGHFIGLTPDALRENVAWSAVELDSLTGRMARTLYPGTDMRVQGFETARYPDGYFDLSISNVPFGNYSLRDPRYRPLSIHDYFFVKALDKVRPGGIVALVTSHFTLDKKSNIARREMAQRADFLGAIRLPGGGNGAFKANAGTDVTADIIFLRKRREGDDTDDQSWLETTTIDSVDGPVEINRYFAANPSMMLGEMRLTGTMHSTPTAVLMGSSDDIEAQIAEAAKAMQKDAFRARDAKDTQIAPPEADPEALRHKEGAFFLRGGVVHRSLFGVGERQQLSPLERGRLTSLIEIRDIVNELLEVQAKGGDSEKSDDLRSRLNRTYDDFHRRYGPINKTSQTVTSRLRRDGTPVIIRRMPNFAAFREDPDAFKVAAIEIYSERNDSAGKAAIFTHDVLRADEPPQITGPSDALALSLNAKGAVDITFIADALDMSEDAAIAALGAHIWLDPVGDVWRTAEDYLSGDVLGKLENARLAATDDERYLPNVRALEAVQPAPLTRVDIRVLFGAPWVPVDIYHAFFSEALNVKTKLVLNGVSKKWGFADKPDIPLSTETQYATARTHAKDIFEAAINNGEIQVYDANSDPKLSPIFNAAASEEGNAKVLAVRELFSGSPESGIEGWVWQDEERASALEDLYNKKFNRLVPTVYDGSHQTLPGLARYIVGPTGEVIPFELRPHQKNAIWRIVSSGNALIDHCVGAGKTFTMIGAGMEQKRLRLIKRPGFIVPNSMLEQFSREFLQAYPGAKILVADKESMTRDKRRHFAARAAADQWDAIITTHDSFGRLRMSEKIYQQFIEDELGGLEDFIEKTAWDEGKDSPTVKDLERAKKRVEAKLDKLLNEERKDDGITFEELGVDFLFIDEAHLFKNLAFQTRHTRVKGISAASDAQRATDLFIKIQYLEEKRPGRSRALATGTPVSNSIAEIYTMQRYLQLAALRSYGIDGFDAWAATFGDIITQVELAPSGKGFRTTRSFSKFVNIPEFIALYSRVADTQTAEMLQLPRPKLKNGKVTVVQTELSPLEALYMESLVERAEAIKGKPPGSDNMLKILGEGLKLATDIRLLNPAAAFNPNGKIAAAVERISQIWRDGKEPALCQLVFLDMGVPSSRQQRSRPKEDDNTDLDIEDDEETPDLAPVRGRFNLYEDIRQRLVDRGIPRSEIAFIHEADNDIKKAQLFERVRAAEVRILIGSTGKMGVGVNVQRYCCAMHHLDAPWRPADVEQRDGRILRQGNLNEEIEIFRYITLRSLDAYRWQTLTTKASFIAQLRAGARGVRTAEDINSPLPEAAMIKAAATGDPRIMEHAELTKEIRDLEAARRGHERSVGAAKSAFERTQKKIAHLRSEVEFGRGDAALAAKDAGEAFSFLFTARHSPLRCEERKTAGEAMKTALLQAGAKLFDTKPVTVPLGELQGFTVRGDVRMTLINGLAFSLSIEGRRRYSRGDDVYALNADIDPVGLVRRCEGLVKSIPKVLVAHEDELVRAEAELPRLERQLVSTGFAKGERLSDIKQRVAQLEKDLNPANTPNAAPETAGEHAKASEEQLRTAAPPNANNPSPQEPSPAGDEERKATFGHAISKRRGR